MANDPQIHQLLTQFGAPPELASRFASAGGVVHGLNVSQWVQLAGKYGPILWQILQDILASQNNQPVDLAPYQGQEAPAGPGMAPPGQDQTPPGASFQKPAPAPAEAPAQKKAQDKAPPKQP